MAAPRRPSGGGLRRAPQDGRLDEINKVGLGPPPEPTPERSGEGARGRGGERWVQEEVLTPLPRPFCPNPFAEGILAEEEAGFLRGSLSIPSAPGITLCGCSFHPVHRASAALIGARGVAAVKFPLGTCSSKNRGYCSPGGFHSPLCFIEHFNFFFPE